MSYRLISNCATLFCISVAMLCAADKKLPIDETSNDVLAISVSAPLDKDQIKQELGSDLGDDIVVGPADRAAGEREAGSTEPGRFPADIGQGRPALAAFRAGATGRIG